MSKKIFIVAGLMIIVIAFSGCSLLKGDKEREATKSESDTGQNQENKESSENENESFFGSMQDLLTRGKSLKCTYKNISDEGGEVTGIVYVADNKRRTEFEIIDKETNEKIEMNSMHVGDWMYS